MNTFLNISIVWLGFILILALVLAIAEVFGLLNNQNYICIANANLLPGIAISCGGLIALLTYIRDKSNQRLQKQRATDEIYLNIARDSFDEVFDLLKDRNNDRLTWVRASRLLLNALNIKKQIKTQDIIDAFEVAEDRLRTELYRTLSILKEGSKSIEPLPPQFFYGIKDWETEKNLDSAAIKSSGRITCSSVTIDENLLSPYSSDLSIKSVITIYDFLEYPKEYKDPLDDVQEWDDNWADSHGEDQGARRYVSHKRINSVVDGKIYKRDKK